MDRSMQTKFYNVVLAFFLLGSPAGLSQSDSPYEAMLKVMDGGPHEVGHCLITTEIDPVDDNEIVVITEKFGTPEESVGQLKIQNPNKTRGEAVTTYDKGERLFSYRQSDFFGWTHLDVGLDEQGQISMLSIFKTRPDGQVYLNILKCEK